MLPCLAGCLILFFLPSTLFLLDPVLWQTLVGSLAVFFRETPIDMHRRADLADKLSFPGSFHCL